MNSVLHALMLFCTVELRNDNTCAGAEPEERVYQHINDRADSADSRKSRVADIVADDPAVNRVVKLLKKIPEQ